jgi:serine/threonine protein kinase
MLTPSETPVIVGFGQSFRPNSSYRTDNVVYIAPEQLQSSAEQIGPRADVYSLGAIFYQILTGHLPSGNVADLEFPSDLDPSVLETSRKALASKPDDRYHSMQEFVAALMQIRQPQQRPPETDLRMPLSASQSAARLPGSATGTPLPFGGPPSFLPTGGAPSATFSRVQELRHLSGTYTVGANAPPRKSPYRKPQQLRWLILGVVGGLALITTLTLLSDRSEKPKADQPAFAPDLQSKEEELASEKAKLIKDLNDQKLDVRRASAERLRDFPGDDVSRALTERISDDFWPETREDNGSDRAEALFSLRMRNKSAVPSALERAMKSTNDRVRIWACVEIVHAADPALEPTLVAALKDPTNGRVRMLAAEGLRQLRWDTKPAIDALSKRVAEPWNRPSNPTADDLSDPRNSGRETAMEALISLSPESAESCLQDILKNKSGALQAWAMQYLGRLQGKKPGKK